MLTAASSGVWVSSYNILSVVSGLCSGKPPVAPAPAVAPACARIRFIIHNLRFAVLPYRKP